MEVSAQQQADRLGVSRRLRDMVDSGWEQVRAWTLAQPGPGNVAHHAEAHVISSGAWHVVPIVQFEVVCAKCGHAASGLPAESLDDARITAGARKAWGCRACDRALRRALMQAHPAVNGCHVEHLPERRIVAMVADPDAFDVREFDGVPVQVEKGLPGVPAIGNRFGDDG